jgi:cysteine synthase A
MMGRLAQAVVDGALQSGRLSPTRRLIEYTGGSTGASLAFVWDSGLKYLTTNLYAETQIAGHGH